MNPIKPKIVTLCGSARFEKDFKLWNEALSLAGHAVFTLAVYPSDKTGGKEWYTPEEKTTLDEAHRLKITSSDVVIFINRHGYLGASSLAELDLCKSLGKKIYFVNSWGRGCGTSGLCFASVIEEAEELGLKVPVESPVDTSGDYPWAIYDDLLERDDLHKRLRLIHIVER